MKLALLQEKQNALYDFAASGGAVFSFAQAEKLRGEMIEQNFSLMETAVSAGADFLVTSEAINFPGPPERLAFPAWDLVSAGYDALTETRRAFLSPRPGQAARTPWFAALTCGKNGPPEGNASAAADPACTGN